jgi:predicted amidohydrolase YtcJ
MKTRYVNGTFYSMNEEKDTFSSLITENGVIIAINDVLAPVDRTIDCHGGMILPGFVDAHLHIAGYGQTLTLPNLHKRIDRNWILAFLHQHLTRSFLYVQGYVEQGLTKVDLDAISTKIPILLRHHDYHSATVNSTLLSMLGIKHPTGILKEEDAQKAVNLVPPYTLDELTHNIKTAIDHLHQFGITGGHSDDLFYFNGYNGTLSAFKKALQQTKFRTHLLIHHEVIDDYVKSKDKWLDQSPFLQLGAVKLFYDGTISSQTALMSLSYSNHQQGHRIFELNAFEALLVKLRNLSLPIAVHTIGDLALDELTSWLMKYPPKKGLHDRIIHASFAKPSTLATLAKLPVILDIQPQFVSSDLPDAYQWIHPKTALIYPWKSYMDYGITICGGSDAPVETPNPLLGIKAAFTRQSDKDHQVYQPEQRLSMFESFKLYTTYSQIPTYHQNNRGHLALGFLADFTILNLDVIKNPKQLDNAEVIMTIIDDQIVYQRHLNDH